MTRKILILALLLAVVRAYYAATSAGKPRKLSEVERTDSINRRKPIGRG